MSQLSQLSQLSDILQDVDNFMEENGLTEDVGKLLNDNALKSQEDEDIKPIPQEFFGTSNTPPSLNPPVSHYPPDQPSDLCNDEYSGSLNFEVYVIPNEQRTPWEYSTKLNKIFILANMKFPVAFSVKSRPLNKRLFIRATPIFSQAQFFQETVRRCIAHQHPQDSSNKDVPAHVFRHIIRCANDDTIYCGDQDERSRLSLIIPLSTPQTGTEVVKEYFSFVCQNSCPSGMNRRPIEVIFTLEDQNGLVLGRRVLCARICKCPKRDKEKEEGGLNNNNQQQPTQAKKRKLTPNNEHNLVDSKLFSLKDVTIVGKHNYLQMLKFGRDLMAGEIVKREGKNGADVPFRKCFHELNAKINQTSME